MEAANALQTTLLLLYFVGQPPSDPKGLSKADLESKINWTLQSTSQIETPSPQACRSIGNQLINRIDKVNTMTVRAYCLCSNAAGVACPGTEELSKQRDSAAAVQNNESGTVVVLGRSTNSQRRGMPRN